MCHNIPNSLMAGMPISLVNGKSRGRQRIWPPQSIGSVAYLRLVALVENRHQLLDGVLGYPTALAKFDDAVHGEVDGPVDVEGDHRQV
jgi:hypothetical protein